MAGIIPLDFETNAMRVVMQDGEPLFVAADVCRAVEISKYRDAVAQLDEDERVSVLVDTLGGKQTMTAVTESGLYALIMMSRKPAAKRFRKWVTAEVLPTIRRTGSYALPGRDGNDLTVKRTRFDALPMAAREKALAKAEAMAAVRQLIADGAKVSEAVAQVAAETDVSVRTIYNARNATFMVPRDDWGPALMHKGHRPRGMQVECHPDARLFFLDLCATGAKVTDCYRRLQEVADERGWSPIPAISALRREAKRALSAPRSLALTAGVVSP